MQTSLASPVVVNDTAPATVGPLGLGALLRGSAQRHAPTRGCMSQAQALLVFDFGRGNNDALCQTNSQLADVANHWRHVPVLAQTETATALARTGRLVIDIEDEARTLFDLGPTAYVDTSQVASAAAALMGAAGWETLAVIAHPSHANRCFVTVEATGLHAVAPAVSSDDADFDRKSAQWWTRRRGSWVARELAVLLHHRVTGRLKSPL